LKILFLGKYPPIEGGESSKAYWLVKSLSSFASIAVGTNSLEVELPYRAEMTPQDYKVLRSGVAHFRSSHDIPTPHHIPFSKAYLEKILSIAFEVAEEFKPDLIFSWYLLPYAIAGGLVSKAFNLPHVIRHGGSDITRLADFVYFSTIIKRTLIDSSLVLSYSSHAPQLRRLGCNVAVHAQPVASEFSQGGVGNRKGRSHGSTILFVGKCSIAKGAQIVLRAADRNPHIRFRFVGERIRDSEAADVSAKGGRLEIMPPVPPWKMPAIYHAADAVIVPELDFVVPHRSLIPLEAVACGKKVILGKHLSDRYPSIRKGIILADLMSDSNLDIAIRDALRASENEAMQNVETPLLQPMSLRDYASSLMSAFSDIVKRHPVRLRV